MVLTTKYPDELVTVQRVRNGQLAPVDGYNFTRTPVVFADVREFDLVDDMLYAALPGGPWSASTSGAGATAAPLGTYVDPANSGSMGVIHLQTGTTATGMASFYCFESGVAFGTGELRLAFRCTVDLLSKASEEFSTSFGFHDTLSPAAGFDATDGAYFRYLRTVDGDFWACITANNGSRTKTVTAVAPAVGVMHRFDIWVDEAALSVWFFIDGVQVALHATNIPTASGRQTGIGAKILKSNGTTSRGFAVDTVRFLVQQSAARG